MNREIKFRGKRLYDNDCNKTKNGEWAFGYLTECFDGKKAIFKPYKSYLSPAEKHRVDESTIGQFTGLRDIKGNDIYEGDILELDFKSRKCIEFVEFRDGRFVSVDSERPYKADGIYLWLENATVIGNIFDNPELLKGGAE